MKVLEAEMYFKFFLFLKFLFRCLEKFLSKSEMFKHCVINFLVFIVSLSIKVVRKVSYKL